MTTNTHELPSMVTNELGTLTPADHDAFVEEYTRHRKSTLWAYITWAVGWHIGYIEGRWGFNVVYFFGNIVTLGIWGVVELFRVHGRLRHQRSDAAIAALRDLRAIRATAVPVPA